MIYLIGCSAHNIFQCHSFCSNLMLKHEFTVVAIHFDTQWQKVNLCGFVIFNSTAYVSSHMFM